jgi:hypothetical protein
LNVWLSQTIEDAPPALGASEKLATSKKTTIVIERQHDGKMRVTSGPWEGEKVFFRAQVLEARNASGRIHVARKLRQHDECAPYGVVIRERFVTCHGAE